MGRILLTLAYDGAAYAGWQSQPDAVTIQGTIEGVLAHMAGRQVALVGAGRTDSGVHALAQAAHFDAPADYPPDTWAKALNAQLPKDIAVLSSVAVADDFHARHASVGKHYRYRILNRPVRCPFRRGMTWFVPYGLDVEAMDRGANLLLGEHDFSSFRAAGCGARHAVRTVTAATVFRHGDEVHLEVHGNGFLKQMVRNLAGTLVEVGRGRQAPEWIGHLLEVRDRTRAGETAPAQGLTLVAVGYP